MYTLAVSTPHEPYTRWESITFNSFNIWRNRNDEKFQNNGYIVIKIEKKLIRPAWKTKERIEKKAERTHRPKKIEMNAHFTPYIKINRFAHCEAKVIHIMQTREKENESREKFDRKPYHKLLIFMTNITRMK